MELKEWAHQAQFLVLEDIQLIGLTQMEIFGSLVVKVLLVSSSAHYFFK
jgi:hypothetical protein